MLKMLMSELPGIILGCLIGGAVVLLLTLGGCATAQGDPMFQNSRVTQGGGREPPKTLHGLQLVKCALFERGDVACVYAVQMLNESGGILEGCSLVLYREGLQGKWQFNGCVCSKPGQEV